MLNKKNQNLKVPSHIGFIMDGNGRWATKRGLPRAVGYRHGVDALKKVVDSCLKWGVKVISIFAFSTENWGRPQDEIDEIFNLVKDLVSKDLQFFLDRDIKLFHMGNRDKVPSDLLANVDDAIEKTSACKTCTLNIGFDYGGRDEIVRACNSLIENGKKEISETDLTNALQTSKLGDIDFLVRTSGEQRVSNFMLWQIAYSEIYFEHKYWPDMNEKYVDKFIEIFNSRNRRFGKI